MATYVSEDEVVYDVSEAKTAAEAKALEKHNERAKILRAERRERERLEEPSIYERFWDGIKRLFGRVQQKQAEQSQQKSR